MHCYVERYKIIATPINYDKFTEFDMKSKKSDLKIKKPKNLTFEVFRFLKSLKFFKLVFTALAETHVALNVNMEVPRSYANVYRAL